MRKPEQQLWDRMRKAMPPDIRLERIENAVSEGIPDVLSLCCGRVVFCELKQVAAAPKREDTRMIPSGKGLRRSQLNWHLEWRRHGGTGIIIVGVGVNKIYCLNSVFADRINFMTGPQMEFYSIASNWAEVAEFLKGITN